MDDVSAAVVDAVPSIPVTVKMRAGWDKSSLVIPEAGMRLEKLGIKAITFTRTTKQVMQETPTGN